MKVSVLGCNSGTAFLSAMYLGKLVGRVNQNPGRAMQFITSPGRHREMKFLFRGFTPLALGWLFSG